MGLIDKGMFQENKRPKRKRRPYSGGITSVHFSAAEYEEIKQEAHRLGVSISDLIRWRNAKAKEMSPDDDIVIVGKKTLRIL